MFDTETFLTTLYVEVDTRCKALPQATPWESVALSLSEVVTLALFGQRARFASERAFYRFAEHHLHPFFPTLPDRTQFNRLQRRAHDVLVTLAQQWADAAEALACAAGEGGAGTFEVLDTLGVVIRNVKRRGSGWLVGQAGGAGQPGPVHSGRLV